MYHGHTNASAVAKKRGVPSVFLSILYLARKQHRTPVCGLFQFGPWSET